MLLITKLILTYMLLPAIIGIAGMATIHKDRTQEIIKKAFFLWLVGAVLGLFVIIWIA